MCFVDRVLYSSVVYPHNYGAFLSLLSRQSPTPVCMCLVCSLLRRTDSLRWRMDTVLLTSLAFWWAQRLCH
jgi:hypothetical protein